MSWGPYLRIFSRTQCTHSRVLPPGSELAHGCTLARTAAKKERALMCTNAALHCRVCNPLLQSTAHTFSDVLLCVLLNMRRYGPQDMVLHQLKH